MDGASSSVNTFPKGIASPSPGEFGSPETPRAANVAAVRESIRGVLEIFKLILSRNRGALWGFKRRVF